MTWSGSSAAISVTKSHSPRSTATSNRRLARSRVHASRRRTLRGEKPLFTSLRRRTWRGGSVVIMTAPPPPSVIVIPPPPA